MGWIKRNLFLVVGGVIALLSLGGTGFYIFKGWSNNSTASATLNDIYAKLQELAQSPQQPGNDKIDNMKLAKDQEQHVREWMAQAAGFFHPIPAIPQGEVTSKTYATALGTTVYQLRQEARDMNVNLPPEYNFSFQAQSSKLTISSGLGPLAQQLGEVKCISEILFGAQVNELVGIQRVRMSDDDAQGSPADYIDERPVTNDLAVITPYVVTFRTFTPELAKVVAGFAKSTNSFIVKSIAVQPAAGATTAPGMAMPTQPEIPSQYPAMRGQYPGQPGMPGQYPGQPVGTPMAEPQGKGGLQTVLKEQLLQITLEVEIVKLLPKS